ncbi:MAG: Hsp20/alpha crystallin family protein [Candidatus Bathyarchaeia archaeon]
MRGSRRDQEELATLLATVAGVAVIGVVVALLIRLQRGLLGVILSAIAAALLAYWLGEVRSLIKRRVTILPTPVKTAPKRVTPPGRDELIDETWTYDLYETKEGSLLVARVPGPEKDVKVSLSEGVLKIWGGHGFAKSLPVSGIGGIKKTEYKNGVLVVELAKPVERTKRCQRGMYIRDAE